MMHLVTGMRTNIMARVWNTRKNVGFAGQGWFLDSKVECNNPDLGAA